MPVPRHSITPKEMKARECNNGERDNINSSSVDGSTAHSSASARCHAVAATWEVGSSHRHPAAPFVTLVLPASKCASWTTEGTGRTIHHFSTIRTLHYLHQFPCHVLSPAMKYTCVMQQYREWASRSSERRCVCHIHIKLVAERRLP